MSKAKFFSNSTLMLDHRDSEASLSLKDTRANSQRDFNVPKHNVGTPNLMIFLNGRLSVPDRDYIDISSTQVRFTNWIGTRDDFHAVLIKTSKDTIYKDCTEETPPKWESF